MTKNTPQRGAVGFVAPAEVRRPRALAAAVCLLVAALQAPALAQPANLLRNGDFAAAAAAQPVHWQVGSGTEQTVTVAPGQGPDGTAALQAAVRAAHEHQGYVEQRVKVEPNAPYVIEGDVRSSIDGLAFLQAKLYRNGRELRRVSTGSSAGHWRRVRQEFSSGEADEVGVLCRFSRTPEAVGQTAWFAQVSLVQAPLPETYDIRAVATFSAIGVRVPYRGRPGPRDRVAVRFRPVGEAAWRPGLPLFFCPPDGEFRGSLMGLAADTEYEVSCGFDGSLERPLSTTVRTWSEEVPVGTVRHLPAGLRREPLVIRESGRPDGWIVYRPEPGVQTVIDVGQAAPQAVLVDQAAYVMVFGLTIRGGSRNGVQVWDSHHVRVSGCDISQWGDPGTPKAGLPAGLYVDAQGRPINYHAGVRVAGGSRQVVVEHNLIHAPRGTANSWEFGHPMGPQGLILDRTGGNNVVRWNDIVGSETTWWNDAIESIPNGSVNGGPYQDTDIHGNLLAFSNDDGTELDGGQINVRYHHNWICWALCGISHAPNVSGPSYAFRNLIANLGDERMATGSAFKMGGNLLSPGMNVILHNTFHGPGGGLRSVGFGDGPDRGAYIAFARNNVFAGPGSGDLYNVSTDPRNDFDHNLSGRGGVSLAVPGEANGLAAAPRFMDAEAGDFRLAPGSAGTGRAEPLPTVNAALSDLPPDMGAFDAPQPGDDGCFPPRPGGMSALPLRSLLRHRTGQVSRQTVSLTAPAILGTRWTAVCNAPWLVCEPASGATADGPQAVRVGPVPGLAEARLHRGAVTFRTDGGFCRTVLVDVRVYPARDVMLVFEAEDGLLAGGFEKVADPSAANGFYIHAPEAQAPAAGAADQPSEPGTATFTISVPESGTYTLMGRCFVLGPRDFAVRHDSFFYSLDGGEKRRWDLWMLPYDRWSWATAEAQDRQERVPPLQLEAGTHRLVIHAREPLARLDRIALTNNPYGEFPPE